MTSWNRAWLLWMLALGPACARVPDLQIGSLLALGLSGCYSSAIRQDLDRVQALTSTGGLPKLVAREVSPAVADDVKELLREPLDADPAVRIALLNNRELRASLRELGIARTAHPGRRPAEGRFHRWSASKALDEVQLRRLRLGTMGRAAGSPPERSESFEHRREPCTPRKATRRRASNATLMMRVASA